jgi:hypothetical protein
MTDSICAADQRYDIRGGGYAATFPTSQTAGWVSILGARARSASGKVSDD